MQCLSRRSVLFVLFSLFLGLSWLPNAVADLNPRDLTTPLMHQTWAGPDNQYVTCSLDEGDSWWWGTDNDGLWRFVPNGAPGKRWQHFRAEDGLYDDSITALCVDRKGRLWVGTERRGVSIYNNSWWENYDIMSGPLGAHVTSIAVNPVDGDVWVTSEGGVSIYSDGSEKWTYINATNGLITDKLNCVAFTPNGTAIIGTCDNGILIGTPKDGYRSWKIITAPPNATTLETGPGIAGNQINCAMVNKAGKIFCGTTSGLAESADGGNTWTFLHGWNWQEKITQYARAAQQIHYDEPVPVMHDDYVTCLAFDAAGLLYIGHRFGGVEVFNDASQAQIYYTRLISYGTHVRSLTLVGTGGLLMGNYGGGISKWSLDGAQSKPQYTPTIKRAVTTFPAPALSLSSSDLADLSKATTTVSAAKSKQISSFLNEDWQTQGNWVGRYGKEYVELCAESGAQDYTYSAMQGFSVTPSVGINGGYLSHWLEWEQSGDPRVLYDPLIQNRREAEWDDQGENNDILSEGPDIWLTVQVPAGVHRMSLYFMNKDGHTRTARFRDYDLELMGALPGVDYHSTYSNPAALPVLAETRVENFWPGVYETFLLYGPNTYYVKISRNFSLNTAVQAIFFDPIGPAPGAIVPPWMKNFSLTPSVKPAASASKKNSTRADQALSNIKKLWMDLDSLINYSFTVAQQRDTRILLLRSAAANGASPALLAAWRAEIPIWAGDDWSTYSRAIQEMNQQAEVKSKE
jgi:hypothetical protein